MPYVITPTLDADSTDDEALRFLNVLKLESETSGIYIVREPANIRSLAVILERLYQNMIEEKGKKK